MSKQVVIQGKQRHIKGWKVDRPDHRDLFKLPSLPQIKALPDHTDLRSYCSPIKDQDNLGSCTAHAASSAMEFLAVKLGKTRTIFSPLFIYYAERVKIEQVSPSDDSGAQIRDTIKSLTTYGTCSENTWPYKIDKFSINPPTIAWMEAVDHQILKYYRCYGLDGIRNCIAEGYSLIGGFSVPDNMNSAEVSNTGIVRYPKSEEPIIGGHAIHLVGYDDKTHQVVFQNSWGSEWGDKGFGYLDYKFFTTGLATDFWTIRTEEY